MGSTKQSSSSRLLRAFWLEKAARSCLPGAGQPEEKIRTWVNHYRLHGVAALQPKRGAYTAELKLHVLTHQDRKRLSSRQVAAICDIRNPNQVVVWRRAFDGGGVAALEGRRPAHPMKADKPNPEPPDTDDTSSNRALREEVERLRPEVAYLKNWRPWFEPIGKPRRKSASRPRAEARLPVVDAADRRGLVAKHVLLPSQGLGDR